MNTMIYLHKDDAKAAGYHALTSAYQVPHEQSMLDNVLADLRRGDIKHCLVESDSGVAVWRAGGACTHSGFAGDSAGPGKNTATGRVGQKRRFAAALPTRTAQRTGGSATGQHLAPALSPARRGRKMSRLTSAATKGKRA